MGGGEKELGLGKTMGYFWRLGREERKALLMWSRERRKEKWKHERREKRGGEHFLQISKIGGRVGGGRRMWSNPPGRKTC